jgi:hypothetical protein
VLSFAPILYVQDLIGHASSEGGEGTFMLVRIWNGSLSGVSVGIRAETSPLKGNDRRKRWRK